MTQTISIFFNLSITLYLFSSFSSIEMWILLFEKVVCIELELVESFLILAISQEGSPIPREFASANERFIYKTTRAPPFYPKPVRPQRSCLLF